MRLNRLSRVLAGAAALCGAAATASANVEVGATAGPHLFSESNELGVNDAADATSLRNSVLFGLRLGFTFTDMLGVEAEGGVIPGEGREQVINVWTATFRAHLLAQFGAANPSRKLVPFAVLGGGAIRALSSGDEDVFAKDTDELFYLGAGVKYRVENGWGLRADLRGLLVPSSKVTDAGESDTAPAFDAELLFSVYKEYGRKAPPKAAEPVEQPPPVADSDGDGATDDVDGCPMEAEDADGFNDTDGCPDADNDGDGIADAGDSCPMEAEDADGFNDADGCPDADNDNDGLADAADRCPNEAEDRDNFGDEDGCPDPDNDNDGVADAADLCPDQLETRNGFKDGDGCADEIPAAVAKFTGVIKGIEFKTNSAEVAKSSFKVLDAAAKVMTENPDIRLEVQGHTDDVGDRDANVALSQARAESVKAYLVGKGIDAARLEAKGFGPDAPLDLAKSKAARAKNRRVEFKLLTN